MRLELVAIGNIGIRCCIMLISSLVNLSFIFSSGWQNWHFIVIVLACEIIQSPDAVADQCHQSPTVAAASAAAAAAAAATRPEDQTFSSDRAPRTEQGLCMHMETNVAFYSSDRKLDNLHFTVVKSLGLLAVIQSTVIIMIQNNFEPLSVMSSFYDVTILIQFNSILFNPFITSVSL